MIRAILTVFAAVFFLIGCCPLLFLERGIFKEISQSMMYRTSHFLVRGVFKVMLFFSGVKTTVVGLEKVPDDRAVLYIPNHRSYYDIFLMFTLAKGQCGIVGKDSIRVVPFLASWMDCVHCLLLDRDNPRQGFRVIMQGAKFMEEGVSMVIFPEGHRSKTDDLLPFKAGSFVMATKSGCPIIPVAIKGSDEIFEKHVPFVRSTHVTVTFGDPIETAGLTKAEQNALPDQVRDIIKGMLS